MILALADVCFAGDKSPEDESKSTKAGKYPFNKKPPSQSKYLKSSRTNRRIVGYWSAWSLWSPCSRTCGGGVTYQTRHCIMDDQSNKMLTRKNRYYRRKRRQNKSNGCVGLYKRIHLCNIQDCNSRSDFRYEQCASFNSRNFKGKTYRWEPYLQVSEECALNCRALGQEFYATLNRTVIDGTSCRRPVTSSGKLAPKGSRGVCIEGICKYP